MTDKILKEAFDKLTQIEEGGNEPYQNYKPEEANDQYDGKTGKWSRSGQYDHLSMDDPAPYDRHSRHDDKPYDLEEGSEEDVKLHDAAIDLLDDMLFALDKNDQYGEKGNILRYAIGRLQQVGLGR